MTMWLVHFATNFIRETGSIGQRTVTTTAQPSALVRSLRPNYPFSVIPGGAYSGNELRFANARDSLVRWHYVDFDLKHAAMVRLAEEQYEYVSYRRGSQVYWTKKKLRIPSGELLLTDGSNYARARCGNRLSELPLPEAASAMEPAAGVLSLPAASMEMLPNFAFASPQEKQEIPTESRTAAQMPPALSDVSAAIALKSDPYIPLESVWGGQPMGGSPVLDGLPVGGIEGSSVNSSPLISASAAGASTISITPLGALSKQPAIQTAPVPEANTAYMVFVTLLFAAWGLLRARRQRQSRK